MAPEPRSIVVVGAGIFGITAAVELRARGWIVTVIDPGPVPRPTAASTDISKVVRMDYGADDLYTTMAEAAMEGWDGWNSASAAPLYHQDGFLLLSREAMARGGFEYESFERLRRRGQAAERLRPGDLNGRFSAWRADQYPDGYFNPRAGWVESGKVLERLAAEAEARGVTLIQGVRFEGLIESRGRVHGIRVTDARAIRAAGGPAAGPELRADVVLAAAGAWTPTLLPHLADVMWATGHPVVHLDVQGAGDWQAPRFPVWAADISRTGWYGFPAVATGVLKIARHGAGRRVEPDAPRTVRPAELAPFHEFLQESLPGLRDRPIAATRLCLYCDTFDGDFWIDHDPDRPGLVVAAGDSGHGFKFAPVLGPLTADIVECRPNPWAHRFRWRRRAAEGKEAARAMYRSAR
ncbi:MAG: FAD-dependent oxidoreductase [Acidobacteriota bacterium]